MASTHYDTLQVKRDASLEVIKGAYRFLTQKWHPDKHPLTEKANAEAMTKALTTAYDILSNPDSRRDYDQLLAEGAHGADAGTTQASFSEGARWEMAKSIARARWPVALVVNAAFTLLIFGLALNYIGAVERWSARSPISFLLAWLLLTIAGATSDIRKRERKLLESNDDGALRILFEDTAGRKAVWAISGTVAVVSLVIGVVFWNKQRRDSPPRATQTDEAAPTQRPAPAQSVTAPAALGPAMRPLIVVNNCYRSMTFVVTFDKSTLHSWTIDGGKRSRLAIDNLTSFPTRPVFYFGIARVGDSSWQGSGEHGMAQFEGYEYKLIGHTDLEAPEVVMTMTC